METQVVCRTNGCDELVDPKNGTAIRFCMRCRSDFGRRTSEHNTYIRVNAPSRTRGGGDRRFAAKIQDGFDILRAGDEE